MGHATPPKVVVARNVRRVTSVTFASALPGTHYLKEVGFRRPFCRRFVERSENTNVDGGSLMATSLRCVAGWNEHCAF